MNTTQHPTDRALIALRNDLESLSAVYDSMEHGADDMAAFQLQALGPSFQRIDPNGDWLSLGQQVADSDGRCVLDYCIEVVGEWCADAGL